MTKIQRKQTGSKADQYASRMFSGEFSPADEQEIATWQAADPENAAKLESSLEAWASVEGLADDQELLDSIDEASQGHIFWNTGKGWRTVGIAAGILALGLTVVLTSITWMQNVDTSLMQISTSVGEQKTIILPDGSKVILNTDSELIVRYTSDHRRVILEQGEVFFDIAPESPRPFTVELGLRSVTALGTQFNIRKIPGYELTVAVIEGIVAVHRKDDFVSPQAQIPKLTNASPVDELPDQYRLEAGTVIKLKSSASTVTKVSKLNGQDYSSWIKGFVRFEGAPLHEVVREINRYTNKTVVVEDPTVMYLEVNAVLQLDNLDVVYDGLESTLPIQLTRSPDRIIIRGIN